LSSFNLFKRFFRISSKMERNVFVVNFLLLLAFLQLANVECGCPRRLTSLSPDSTRFVSCDTDSNGFTLHKVKLNDCIRPKCKLFKGTTGTLLVEFTSPVDIPKLDIVIQGVIGGVPIPFVTPGGSDACALISPKLPGTCVRAGVRHTFSMSLPIQSSYPAIPVVIVFRLEDGAKNRKVYMKIPSQLVAQ